VSRDAQPRHVLVQLAPDDRLSARLNEQLVDRVDAALSAAYRRARVTVIFDHSIADDRIAVVAADPELHEDEVRRIVASLRAELRGRSRTR
jgi:hypothetical protein